MVGKTLLNMEHRLQSFEGTLVPPFMGSFEGHHCSILSVADLGTKKGALVQPAARSSGSSCQLDFQAFQSGRNLCKVPGQFWDSRARNCTEYAQKESRRNLRHYWDVHTTKASSKDGSRGMNLPKCSTVLISMLLIAIIFPRTISVCHKYLIYPPSFVRT